MAQLTPQDDYIKTALRLPREVHAQIQQAATASGRSMNAEIVSRLELSFNAQSRLVQAIQQFERAASEKGLQISISVSTEMEDDPS